MAEGITSQSQTYQDLIAGEVVTKSLPVDSTATIAVGQVLKYDSTGHNYVTASNIAPDAAGMPLVVCLEAKTLTGDDYAVCIVQGHVNKAALDSTSQTFADIEAALQCSGIIMHAPISN